MGTTGGYLFGADQMFLAGAVAAFLVTKGFSGNFAWPAAFALLRFKWKVIQVLMFSALVRLAVHLLR